MHCSKHGTEYVSGDNCLPVCLELDDDRWDEHFMADIAGAQKCNNEDEEGRSDIESDREDQAAIPHLSGVGTTGAPGAGAPLGTC